MFKPLAALMSESERESLLVTRETKVLLQDFRGSTLRAAKKEFAACEGITNSIKEFRSKQAVNHRAREAQAQNYIFPRGSRVVDTLVTLHSIRPARLSVRSYFTGSGPDVLVNSKSQSRSRRAIPSVTSVKPSLVPRQPRGPAPKGSQEKVEGA